MKLVHFCIYISIILLCSCQVKGNKENNISADSISAVKLPTDTNMITAAVDSSHTAQNSLDWKGTYKGILPCKDCAGIETEIILHNGNTYMVATKIMGHAKTKTLLQHGDFTWANGSVIELKGMSEGPVKYFVEEGRIILLNKAGKKMEGEKEGMYILTKN